MSIADPMTDRLQVTCISTVNEPLGSAAAWNALADDVPFRRWEWLEAWWRHYRRPEMQPFVLALRNSAGELVGLAPWYLTTAPIFGRVIRFMGSGEVCSDYLTLMIAPEYRHMAIETIAEWLSTSAGRAWDLLELDGVAENDQELRSLIDTLAKRGHAVHENYLASAWCVSLSATWPEYLSRLSRQRRSRVNKFTRRVFDTGRAIPFMAETEAEFERGWKILCDLHQKRRISLGESGCFASPQFTAFHAEVARRFFELGKLRLHWVELDGRPIAVEYGLTGHETIYLYQSGIDPEMAVERPGWLDLIASIKTAIGEGYRAFDFLRGDEPYKASWQGQQRRLTMVRIAGRNPSAWLRHEFWSAGLSAKHWFDENLRAAQRWLPKPSAAAPSAGLSDGS
jgi:CelD/BcsL family acetyltransferase involved in cellulose biosynthesis